MHCIDSNSPTSSYDKIVCGHLKSQWTSRSLLTIQHYKGKSNIDSAGNYEWFFTVLRERTLRPCFPGSLNYGMFAFLKIKLLLVGIAHRGSPQGSLNKFAWNERAQVNTDRDSPSIWYDVSWRVSLNKGAVHISCICVTIDSRIISPDNMITCRISLKLLIVEIRWIFQLIPLIAFRGLIHLKYLQTEIVYEDTI